MIKILSIISLLMLPITTLRATSLPNFSAVYNSRKKAVVIKWQHTASNVKSYIVQQSTDNRTWTDIALQAFTEPVEPRSFYFEHKNTSSGQNHYRLKVIYLDGRAEYSLDVLVIIGALDKSWVMYPVPVTDLLTLEYRGTEIIGGVINVIIQLPTGKVFTKLRYASLSRQIKIPVNNIPKGIYDIRIVVQDEVIWDQRFVK